jgi:hypothetical protein
MYLLREFIYRGVRKNTGGIYDKHSTLFLKSNDYDVLFLGSSRVETHYDCGLFDSITHLNSYNAGLIGAGPQLAYAALRSYCHKSKAPRYLVYDLDLHYLKNGADTIRFFPKYFPYLSNQVMLEQFNEIDSRFSSFYYNPFHSMPYANMRMLGASLHGWMGKQGKFDTCFYKGFQRSVFADTIRELEENAVYGFIHPKERRYLDSIILFSKEQHMDLLLTCSPMYKAGEKLLNKGQMLNQVRSIARINGLSFKDFSNLPLSMKRGNFADHYHMTYSGARLFSEEFSRFFLQYIRGKTVN